MPHRRRTIDQCGRLAALRPCAVAALVVVGAALVACSGEPSDESGASTSSEATSASRPATTTGDTTADEPADGDRPERVAVGEEPDAPFVPSELTWSEYSDDVDVATLAVPVDYDDPDGDQFELFLARHNALDPDSRVGTLIVNPGGPGRAGADYAINAAQVFGTEIVERFDVVAWDPRGTGQSTPFVNCVDDYDPYFTAVDSTPADDAARDAIVATAEAFAAECKSNSGGILDFVGTNNSARDIDSIRQALGEDTISYFGFSYGSELGAVWATLFPDTVRAAVLDGGTDPEADSVEASLQQQRGFEAALDTFFRQCLEDQSCAFGHGGDPRGAYLELLESLDAEPLVVSDDRPPVNRDVATLATLQAMYSDTYWPALERALGSAQFGDGAGLLELHDGYYRRNSDGTYPNFLEAFQAITCADTDERLSIAEADAEVPALHEAAPTLIPADSVGSYFCTFFDPAVDPRADITADGAGPIVVIGTTGDPATPLESAIALADALDDGRLVVVTADRHLGYGVNACINEVVARYLVDLTAPEDGTECT